MIHPSYVELMEVVNEDVVIGEEPVVNSRYSIVLAAAKRARQLIDGAETLVTKPKCNKSLSIAVEEFYKGKVQIVGSDDDEDDVVVMDYNKDVLDLGLGEDVDEEKLFDDEDGEMSEDEDDDDYED